MTSQFFKFIVLCASLLIFAFATLQIFGFFSNLGFHGSIAAALGITLTVVVAVGLMGLMFHSNRSDHDRDVHETGRR